MHLNNLIMDISDCNESHLEIVSFYIGGYDFNASFLPSPLDMVATAPYCSVAAVG